MIETDSDETGQTTEVTVVPFTQVLTDRHTRQTGRQVTDRQTDTDRQTVTD